MAFRLNLAASAIANLILAGWLAVACTGGSGEGRAVNPARPTPGPTPPGIQSVDEAIQDAKYFITGHTNVNLRSARIESVGYVETTVGEAANFLGGYVPSAYKPIPPDTTAWLFVAQGYFAHHDRYSAPPVTRGTLWVLAVKGGVANADIAKAPLDLARLGTPVVIPRGRVAEIDAVRAPAEDDTPIPASTPTPGGALLGTGNATIAVNVPGGSQPLYMLFVVTDDLVAFAPGDSATWAGWDLELLYDTDVLAVDSVVRGNLCSASSWKNTQTAPHVVTGCAFQSSTATGTLEQITFHCIASGTSAITLLARDDPARNASGTALFDPGGVDFTTTVTSASVTCG